MILTKEKITNMKYIDWEHIESMDTSDSRRALETITQHGMKEIMGFKYDWNGEILAQFYATFFHDIEGDTFHRSLDDGRGALQGRFHHLCSFAWLWKW